MSTEAAPKGPDAAVGSFKDPKSGEEVFVIPKEGEQPADAIARVKKDHGANPDLGPYMEFHSNWIQAQEALAAGDRVGAINALKPLLARLSEAEQKEPENGEVRALNQQKSAAAALDSYVNQRSTRRQIATPEIPKEASYEGFFSR